MASNSPRNLALKLVLRASPLSSHYIDITTPSEGIEKTGFGFGTLLKGTVA
jgi:hypothetical protein